VVASVFERTDAMPCGSPMRWLWPVLPVLPFRRRVSLVSVVLLGAVISPYLVLQLHGRLDPVRLGDGGILPESIALA
jgi:hypothetical protein